MDLVFDKKLYQKQHADLPILKVAMSCCIPNFKPIFYKGKCMIDGASCNYYPNTTCIQETNAE